ncbi:hypothetical protein I5G81_gp58 [Mycobacterium phage Shandong1]|uniref:Uncharacterized protein n=1 Tax=Mycobacterium phage Shandong1 TaxID=1983447 RepID=A0A1X9SHL3_9CAUD|nr:hypothetical protein I5G81_gp58 [Mycobacterium phage Shandong1]ARQ95497.1 hypothetical protein [Mycobacterium phage Shandong1]
MTDQAVAESDSKRPWWTDNEVVQFWVEQRMFDATRTYLEGLAVAVEHQIAYAAEDPAAAAKAALQGLDEAVAMGSTTVGDSIDQAIAWLREQDHERASNG